MLKTEVNHFPASAPTKQGVGLAYGVSVGLGAGVFVTVRVGRRVAVPAPAVTVALLVADGLLVGATVPVAVSGTSVAASAGRATPFASGVAVTTTNTTTGV